MQKCYYFNFNNRNVPDDEKHSYDKLVSSKGKEKYVYFNDCPMILNNFIIGSVFQNGNKGTFLYDTEKDKGGIKEWIAHKIELYRYYSSNNDHAELCYRMDGLFSL